jgi:hypothetical protein
MRNFLYVLASLLGMMVPLELAAQSASVPNIQPERQILSAQPSPAQLTAFEGRVEQKWEDFLSYLNLIGQADTEAAFREYARQEALKLFVEREEAVVAWNQELMTDFLSKLLQQGAGQVFKTVPGSFGLHGFDPDEHGQAFSGWFSVQVSENGSSSPITLVGNVYLQRAEKSFGHQVEKVWQVKLGSLEEK